jgi:hypothetical protein
MVGTHKWRGEIGAAIALNDLTIQTGGLSSAAHSGRHIQPGLCSQTQSATEELCHLIIAPGVSMRLSGSQGEQEWFDLWGGINLVQFRIVGENRMEQSRTFLDTEAVIIHRFTCLPRTKKAAPVGFGLKRAFL